MPWLRRSLTRRANAAKLDAGLAANPFGLRTPYLADGATHVYHQYTVRVPAEHRDALQAHLTAQRVGSAVYYPTPVHRLAPFATTNAAVLPETVRAAAEVLSLPVHPQLSDADLDRILAAIHSFNPTSPTPTSPTSGS